MSVRIAVSSLNRAVTEGQHDRASREGDAHFATALAEGSTVVAAQRAWFRGFMFQLAAENVPGAEAALQEL